MKTSNLTGAAIHTHSLELDITVAGVTKTHELRVMYISLSQGIKLLPHEPAQVEIQDIKVIVDFGGSVSVCHRNILKR